MHYRNGFASKHNVYCLKATGALHLLNDEKWDIREISAQMLHKELPTTFTYIAKLRFHNVDKNKRVFSIQIAEKNLENLANHENSPRSRYTGREQTINEINQLSVSSKFS